MTALHKLVNAHGASATILPFGAKLRQLQPGGVYRHAVGYGFSID